MTAINIGSKPNPATDAPLEPGALVSAATPAAQSGPEHVEEPVAYDAILLASFGGPEGQDDVIPFLRNVTRGRGIPESRLEEVAHHYRAFGGVSPINDQNRELKAALEHRLAERGIDLPVLWGNRNWNPYLNDALREANEAGYTKLIGLATSAYSSYSSCRQYREDFADALEDTGLGGVIQIDKIRQYFDHPGFVTPFIEGVRTAFDTVREAHPDIDFSTEVEVLFATHSIPSSDAARSGPAERGFDGNGAYAAQHLAVAEVVMHAVTGDSGTTVPWQLVYQSRSGPPSMPWLEPDVNDAIADLPARGIRAVIVVPLGFVSDHMEVLWDLDNEAKESADEQGLFFVRAPTPGVHAAYVDGLIDLVLERVNGTPKAERPAMTDLGPWYDVCRPGCCENVRLGFKPAVSGLKP
ncbi:ferrochelatase [Planctomonas psychrotolerans]|uniref:ferrochelatase n=1 Tax=Planctomonas psychrotolerans TaxID=2528712 RepID=UPI001239F4A4|nr:ferrochelatase [Planctomonas psychrotolerans]